MINEFILNIIRKLDLLMSRELTRCMNIRRIGEGKRRIRRIGEGRSRIRRIGEYRRRIRRIG